MDTANQTPQLVTQALPRAKASAWEQSEADLGQLCSELGEQSFRGKQIAEWIFAQRVSSPTAMANVSKVLRAKLEDSLDWTLPTIVSRLDSADGATKLLLRTGRGQMIESVLMRYDDRTSLCVSSQVGCKLACAFCQTGKLGFFRNLSAAEILAQYRIAAAIAGEENRRVSHVVFMGMGEPLDNFEAVVKAVNLLTAPNAYGLSRRHVTVSTSGIAPRIVELAERTTSTLALSLHAAREDLRTELMPINRKYPLPVVKEALMRYQELTGNKITIEYILIKNKNCSEREAKELVRFIHGLRAKVNLIPFNAHPGLPFERPDDEEIRNFQRYLSERSIPAPVRYSKGLEVSGACGQLAAKVQESLHAAPERRRVLTH